MIHELLRPFDFEFFRNGLLVATMAGALCGAIGVYVVLKGMSYIGHGLSHAIFGGAVASSVLGFNVFLGAGLWGLVAGTVGAAAAHYANSWDIIDLGSDQSAAFWGAITAFLADALVSVVVSMATQPKPVDELQGLVYGMANIADELSEEEKAWYRKPSTLAIGVLGIVLVLSIIFW